MWTQAKLKTRSINTGCLTGASIRASKSNNVPPSHLGASSTNDFFLKPSVMMFVQHQVSTYMNTLRSYKCSDDLGAHAQSHPLEEETWRKGCEGASGSWSCTISSASWKLQQHCKTWAGCFQKLLTSEESPCIQDSGRTFRSPLDRPAYSPTRPSPSRTPLPASGAALPQPWHGSTTDYTEWRQ